MILDRALGKTLIIFSFIFSIIAVQIGFDRLHGASSKAPPSENLPLPVLRVVNMGLNSATGSLVWLKIIQDLLSYQEIDDFVSAIKLTNALDPQFGYPYAFATLILPPAGKLQEALAIGETGVVNAPNDWRIPHYLASTYHMYADDRTRAMLNFDRASRVPGAPDFVHALAASYGISSDKREQTKLIWQSIYEHADNETVRERALQYLEHIALTEALEKGIAAYKKQYGITPTSLEDLVTKKIIPFVPKSPLGLSFELDEKGVLRATRQK